MRNSICQKVYALIFGVLLVAATAGPAYAAEVDPPEFDPVLSLTADCSESLFDPVPDPGCIGDPPAYPSPPGGPVDRFNEPAAIAIDPFGNEYVASFAGLDGPKGRIDVFDDEGKFITEVAVPLPKSIGVDSQGNLYVYKQLGEILRFAPEDSVEDPYEPEAGKIKYKVAPVEVAKASNVGALTIDAANDDLLVANQSITRYKSAAEGNGFVESFEPSEAFGSWTNSIAIDSVRRRIYVTYCEHESLDCNVKVLGADPPHAVLETIDGSTTPVGEFTANSGRLGLGVDEATGDLFVADIQSAKTVYQFSEEYEFLSQLKVKEFQAPTLIQIAVSNGTAEPSVSCDYPVPPPPSGDACNRHYLFIPVAKGSGRALAFQPSDVGAPVIERVSIPSISESEAELQAEIDPNGADTEYRIEITSQASFEAEGFTGATVAGEGVVPGNSLPTRVNALVSGLIPAGSYRFRVVAQNGVGSAKEEGQNEAGFSTYDDAPIGLNPCPNQSLRVGLSSHLPDCRAYELVTPADTNGRPPRGVGFLGGLFTTTQSSPSGSAVSFRIEGGSLPGSSGVGSFNGGDPYVATRSSSGWSSLLAGPSGAEATIGTSGGPSPDQGYSFWTAGGEGPAVIEGEDTEYLRYPDGHSELIGRGSLGSVEPKAKGNLITEHGTHIVFSTTVFAQNASVQLEPNAPPTGTAAVYDRTIDPITGDEETHTVSLLPGNATPAAGENANYVGASQDGEGIAFSIGNTLYLRLGNETSYEIGTAVDFAGISEDGDRVFYVEGGNLKAFDTSNEEVIDFSPTGDVTPVNVANDGSRAAFVSPSVLGGANSHGDEAQAGEQNLYLSAEGQILFVATVTDRDVEGVIPPFDTHPTDGLGIWTEVVDSQPAKDPSRLNPDGSVLLFQSRAGIAGFAASEFPQIYRYDSTEERLHCVSCNPTRTPATGGASLENYTLDTFSSRPFSPWVLLDNMTPDGKRVFFDSSEALVSSDTDEVIDVYEWEEEGVGSCERSGGCVYLISSGHSLRDNFLYAHSVSGRDVFFTTSDGLDSQDGSAAVSIYDARVEGGFPGSVPPECVADGCRPVVTPPPPVASPASPAQGRSGNLGAKKPSSCPKGKRKVTKHGKVRCVKKKKRTGKGAKAKSRPSSNRGVAR